MMVPLSVGGKGFFNLQRIWSLKLNEHGRDIGKLVKKKTMLEP